MVRDSTSSCKIDYVIVIKNSLNPEGHQNPISGSKVMAILLVDLAYWWSCNGKGLPLQPVQQACFSHNKDWVRKLFEILNLKGHQNR